MTKQNSILKNACFTGHRPSKIIEQFNEHSPIIKEIKSEIKDCVNSLIVDGYNTFYCGMAIGGDIFFAETILKLKLIHSHIKLIACVPFKEQDTFFSKSWKKRYHNILNQCDDICYISCTIDDDVYKKRNLYMVNNSHVVIALFNGDKHSGTSQTINLAYSQMKKVIVIKTPDYNIPHQLTIGDFLP